MSEPNDRDAKGVGERKLARREAIVEAAAAVFAEVGFSRAVIAAIARRAGVGKGTVYEYFDSKEELYFAVFEWYMELLAKGVREKVSPELPALERLRRLAEEAMNWAMDCGDMYGLSLDFWGATVNSPMRERFRDALGGAYLFYRQRVAELLREGVARGEVRPDADIEAVAAGLVGAWDALALQAWLFGNLDAPAAGRGFFETLLKGLAVNPERGLS